MPKVSKKGRRKSRYWFICSGCAAPVVFSEWSWVWVPNKLRTCQTCKAVLKPASPAEAANLNREHPKAKHRRKDDYNAYLSSTDWQVIRARVLARDNHRCPCGRPATEVHHRSYAPAVMEGKDDTKLIAMCHGCHDHITYSGPSQKRGHAETERLLVGIIRSNRTTQPAPEPVTAGGEAEF